MAPRDNSLRRSMRRRYASLAPHRTVGSGPAGPARCRPEQFLHLRRSVAMLCLPANAGWQLVPMKSDGTNACAPPRPLPQPASGVPVRGYGIGSRLARECSQLRAVAHRVAQRGLRGPRWLPARFAPGFASNGGSNPPAPIHTPFGPGEAGRDQDGSPILRVSRGFQGDRRRIALVARASVNGRSRPSESRQ
jgi:hypothetical protein